MWEAGGMPLSSPVPLASTTAVTILGLRLSVLCTRGVSETTACHRRERGISSPHLRSLGPCGLGRLRVCYLAGCTVN